MGLLGHAPHQGKAAAAMALMLDLAADHLEVPHLVTRHSTHIRAVEHDNGPARVRRDRVLNDDRRTLPIGRLKLQGRGMSTSAHALMVHRRGR
jgi:hypothetical protein